MGTGNHPAGDSCRCENIEISPICTCCNGPLSDELSGLLSDVLCRFHEDHTRPMCENHPGLVVLRQHLLPPLNVELFHRASPLSPRHIVKDHASCISFPHGVFGRTKTPVNCLHDIRMLLGQVPSHSHR